MENELYEFLNQILQNAQFTIFFVPVLQQFSSRFNKFLILKINTVQYVFFLVAHTLNQIIMQMLKNNYKKVFCNSVNCMTDSS